MQILWREIPEFEGLYEININGDIRSLDRWIDNNGTATEFRKGGIMKPYINTYRNNYSQIVLRKNNKNHYFKIHQLVAKAFPEICGEWFEGCEVDHIDGNPENNSAYNLRVTDKLGNMANEISRERMREHHHKNKKCQMLKDDVVIAVFRSTSEAHRQTGISRNKISDMCNNNYHRVSKDEYTWKFC